MTNLSEPHRATLTVEEAAALLGISRTTAYESVRRGEIPARRFGRRVVVLRHELERLIGLPNDRPHARVARGAADAPLDASR
jgi:excisionase family DNA binding protein